jgi:hypothetical protein
MKNLRKLVFRFLRSRKELDAEIETEIRQAFFDVMAIHRERFEAEDEIEQCNKAIASGLAKIEMARVSSAGVPET